MSSGKKNYTTFKGKYSNNATDFLLSSVLPYLADKPITNEGIISPDRYGISGNLLYPALSKKAGF